jgi:hypothetical protein
MALPASKEGMRECLERIAVRALPEKKTIQSTTEAMLPRRDNSASPFRQAFRMTRMCSLMASHSVPAMSLLALPE